MTAGLPLFDARPLAFPRRDPDLVERLIAALSGRGWVSKARLCAELHDSDRNIRQAAADSGGRVVGHSGRRGYCLTAEASLADVQHVEAELLSRSASCKRRAMEIARVRHGRPDCLGGAA